jgi:hypothetical protein
VVLSNKGAFRLVVSPFLVAVLGILAYAATTSRASGAERKTAAFTVGDVFAGVGTGKIKRFSNAGVLLQTLDTGTACSEDLGMAFDTSGNLYATASFGCSPGTVSKFDVNGTLIGPFGSGYSDSTESITLDAAQNVFVGQPDGTHAIRKFNSGGTFQTQYIPTLLNRGTDWIDMSSDQCTIFYTSESGNVFKYNTCTSTQLANFCTGCGSTMYALKIRSNSEVMAADGGSALVHRFNSSGTQIQSYTDPALMFPFALNLDPDGTTFWTADYSTGQIFRFNIATGAKVIDFNGGKLGCCLSGLSVFGELVVAQPTPSPTGNVPQVAVPTLSFPMLGLLCAALMAAAVLLMRR